MTTLSCLHHKKQFADRFDEIELLVDDLKFYVRVKYANMDASTLFEYKNSTEARFKYTQMCLFILS